MKPAFLSGLIELLGEPVRQYTGLTGGDISSAYLIETKSARYFLKTHLADRALPMLRAEQQGLEAIAITETIKTPAVFHCTEIQDQALLLLEYVETRQPLGADFEKLGYQLASLHNSTANVFGLEVDNFIGSLAQLNRCHHEWPVFYVSQRLMPQLELASRKGLISGGAVPSYQHMLEVCRNLFPKIKPALLHGDLWSGNYLIASDGTPYLIDPAIYFGDSEVDLAMTELFGGFSQVFYDAYAECRPPLPGRKERHDIYQLYYLLVHLNLFGASYYSSVKKILDKYF